MFLRVIDRSDFAKLDASGTVVESLREVAINTDLILYWVVKGNMVSIYMMGSITTLQVAEKEWNDAIWRAGGLVYE